MSVLGINRAAEACIQAMSLNTRDQEIVRSTIKNYSLRESFCENISWVIYRVANAIKSIFGYSDWQIARKMIEERALQMAISHGYVKDNPTTTFERSVKAHAIPSFHNAAGELLSITLLSQEENTDVTPRFQSLIQQISIEQLVASIGNRLHRASTLQHA